MESREAAMASYTTSTSSSTSVDDAPPPPTIKRCRTRRHRPTSSASAATASSSASEAGFTDEEDMANCLILLAQGASGTASDAKKFTSKRFAEAAATAAGRAGFYVYECKTCNKCFPSFQALGGHRASHKKLKMAAEAAAAGEKNTHHLPSPSSKRSDSAGKGKVHECSICQSEFSSGQALGGHMRRHRPAVDLPEELKKEKTALALDLNLPAPAEDDSYVKPLVFSPAAPLVDCLY